MDINTTIIAVFEPFLTTTQSFVGFIKLLFGGIFGLYLVLVILRWHEIRTLRNIMDEIKMEVKKINEVVKKFECHQAKLARKKKK